MQLQPVHTGRSAPPGGAYSQAVVAGGFAFVSGQVPVRPSGEKVTGPFSEQAAQAFANLAAVAEAAGGSLADAVRVGVFLDDLSNFAEMDLVYREFFGEPRPARTTVQAGLPGFAIEVDAIVALPQA
ncbi:MAG: RidA family protein [Acidimicrobiales bacterium]